MIVIYDPKPVRHDYLSPMYFQPMREYAARNKIPLSDAVTLTDVKNCIVCCLADYLDLDTVNMLKNNGNKIVGFSVTDSSYISQSCREAAVMSKVDLFFMLTGIQRINEGHEFIVDKDFNIQMEKRQFLPEQDWQAFNLMRISGRLKSLPYVHAERQPHVEAKPYNLRSQKALIRGGHHMRRFILALKLMEIDRLDINSGFVTKPYFQDDMNPQFRYCDTCRSTWKTHKSFPIGNHKFSRCTNDDFRKEPTDLSDLGRWNNKCPLSFYGAATLLSETVKFKDNGQLEKLMNARWLPAHDHLAMLARITFTADLKWLFSIYAAQRFWDAAMVGCINALPLRTIDQEFFPNIIPGVHYQPFVEDMTDLDREFYIEEPSYNEMSKATLALYNQWMRPSEYSISTNLLQKIFQDIEAIQ